MAEHVTSFDEILVKLACGHQGVVLGRLDGRDTWTCEAPGCGKTTDFRIEPYRSALERDRDIAAELDRQALGRGETLVRSDRSDPPRPEWTADSR